MTPLKPSLDFGQKSFPDSLSVLKKYVLRERLIYISKEELKNIRKSFKLSKFQLSIFYELMGDSKNQQQNSIQNSGESEHSEDPKGGAPSMLSKNALVVNDSRSVIILFNPFA